MNNEVINYECFVRLGLWNFFEILLKGNHLQSVDKSKLASFIWEVSSGSHFSRNDKSVIEKDWQQCWLAVHAFTCLYKNVDYSDCEFLSSDTLEENINLLQKELHFKSLADSLESLNSDVKKELNYLHTRVCHSNFVCRLIPGISQQTVQLLKNCLITQPGIAHSLINYLICSSPSFDIPNKQLLHIYKELVEDYIQKLKSPDNRENNEDLQSTLLSLIVLSDGKWNIIDTEKYCKDLSLLCRSGHLKLSRLLLAAIAHTDLQLYMHLCENEDNLHCRDVLCIKKQDRMTLLKIHSELFNENGSLNISELYLRLIKNKTHWIEDVICLYAQLAMYGDFSAVDTCFQHPLFKKFHPLLVFQLWTYSTSMNQNNLNLICSVLDNCKDFDPVLIQLSDTLEWLKFVIEWVDKEIEIAIPDINTLLLPARRQSLLHLLKAMTDVSRLNPHRVRNFLKLAYRKFNREANLDKEIAVYDGYCILTTILRCIFLSAETGKKESECKGCLVNKRLGPLNKILHKNLKGVKEEIDKLQPLSLRLEILENIFSMLFLRSEDIREDATSDSGADDDDNIRQVSKSRFSIPSVTISTYGKHTPNIITRSLPPITTSGNELNNVSSYSKSLSSIQKPKVISISNILSSEQKSKNKNLKEYLSERGEGFLCTNQLVNDILLILKDSVMNIDKQMSTLDDTESSEIEFRLKRLMNAVDDGIWRLDLLSRVSRLNTQAQNEYVSEWIYTGSEGSDSDSEQTKHEKSKRPKRNTDNADKSSESGSNTTGVGCSGGGSTAKVRKTKKRKNSRKSTIPVSCTLINLMLASPRSLTTYFLALKDIDSASAVIKKFGLEDNGIAVEVNFIIAYENLKKRLKDLKAENIPFTYENKSTLEIINKAASAGFFTVSVTKNVEQFLSLTDLPDVGQVSCRALVALDLALTLHASKSHSESLIGLAIKQCSSYAKNGGLAGACLEQFAIKLNQHLQEEKVQNTIPEILRSPDMLMLNQKSKRQLMHVLWSSISIALSSFSASVDASKSSNAIVACSELAQIIDNTRFAWRGDNSDSKSGENYLHQLRAYVTVMSRIIAPHISVGTPFSVLERNLTDIMQYLVFECAVDPEDIEQMLQQLGIDLVYYLVQTCTPDVAIIQPVKKPEVIVLNSSGIQKTPSELHPNVIVSRLLKNLISALQTEGTDFGQAEAANLVNKSAVQQVLEQTSLLAEVDLSLISSSDESLVFLLNLMNLMWTHALLTLESKGKGVGLLSKSSILREVSYTSVGYDLGDAGFISLHQVYNALIRPLLSSGNNCTSWSSSSASSSFFSLSFDPTWDPRILFVLTSHHILSPKLQVLDVIGLDNQFEWCMSDYVRKSVVITDTTVIIPSLLQLYLDHTTLTQDPESEDGLETVSNASKEHASYLIDFLKENPAFSQVEITGKEIQITDSVGFCIRIDYSRISTLFDYNEENIVTHEENWKKQEIKESVLKYFTVRSPVVGMLVQKLHCIERAEEILNDAEPYHYLEDELSSERINILSHIFNDNQVVATLQNYPNTEVLWDWLDNTLLNNDLEKSLEMISALPEIIFQNEPNICKLKDLLYFKLASIKADGWRWCQRIKNIQLMANGVLNNLQNWSLPNALVALQTLLTQPGLTANKLKIAEELFSDISICQQVLLICGGEDWQKIYKSDCWCVLEKLLDANNFELALKWMQMHKIPSLNQNYDNKWKLIGRLILMLLESSLELTAKNMLTLLQKDIAIKICNFVISEATSLHSLHVVINHLNSIPDVSVEMKNNYVLLDIGVNMLSAIPESDQKWYRPLISKPDLIVEQMLMCTQLSILEKSLTAVERKILYLPNNNPVSRSNIDFILRKYASKAVDIRVRKQNKHVISNIRLQHTGKASFVPPDVPPSKNEWVPNDEVTECMCCQVAIFSMFNRRHHCRRCGRVVCGNCSSKNMKVAGYGNVPVRTCDHCFDYATPKSAEIIQQRTDSELKWFQDVMDKPEWILKTDELHNSLLQEEFSYVPSISLCLSILKLHSLDTVQPEFLIGISESMLSLLRPSIPGVVNPELDYSLLVQMIRSLVLAAKVCYSGLGLSPGMVKCDQLLGEVDILNLLVKAHCCFLLPSFPLNNQLAIRNLRTSLLDHELWPLALEVSTKAGLEYGSVWFAWGKACLRAGAWSEAREKFSHCSLQKKDLQNAGMLADILQILQSEEGSCTLEARLSKLNAMVTGKQKVVKIKENTSKKLDDHVYKECMYYLNRYGTHSQNLNFLMIHADIQKVLDYFRRTSIETEYFVENIYLPCLRNGHVAALYEAMLSIDPKLFTWKDELKSLCAWCEKRGMLNVLYQVQLWMCDYVRAAMTCTRFYLFGARCYRDLISNVRYLHDAITNLKHADNFQKEGSKNKIPPGHDIRMKLDKVELNRHINTIQLQIEITDFFAKDDACGRIAPVTLFSDDKEKIKLAAKILIVGTSINNNLPLCQRIYDMFQLPKHDIFYKAAEQLALADRVNDIQELCKNFHEDSKFCDNILLTALKKKPQNSDVLIGCIHDLSSKIQAFIDCGFLKAAYLLASKHNRLEDVHKIMIAADLINQPLIYKICVKRLLAEGFLPSSSSSST
ncbi:zinc finger FYVE-type containing 26 spastizin [Lycorma delicatula]|uniref:zinc finger FYVE-type containing 26 spastizin n=1 Tax=Lycorma delicatula TaxID=130591 RepID=UPI003F515429